MNPTIIRRILLTVAVVIGGFLTLRLMDLFMAWSMYSWFFETIRNASGMPDTLNGALSIWLVAITLMLLPTLFSVLFWKRDPKKVFLITTAVSGWFVIVYFMSLPQEGRFFNPMTSHAMYRYARTPDGKIDLFPLGYNFHPRYGTKLELVTPEVVKEIDRKAVEELKQQDVAKEKILVIETSTNPNRVTLSNGVLLWAEIIQVTKDRTTIFMACRSPYNSTFILNSRDASGAYVIDGSGQAYNVINSSVVDNSWSGREVRVDETYRFTLTFPQLPTGVSKLRLHFGMYNPALDLDSVFAKAEKIPPVGTSDIATMVISKLVDSNIWK